MSAVPIIDLTAFINEQPDSERVVSVSSVSVVFINQVEEVKRACEEVGFFVVVGHQVSTELFAFCTNLCSPMTALMRCGRSVLLSGTEYLKAW